MNNSTKISGFTLIELIVVILIISIILGFSFPRIRKNSPFSDNGSQAAALAHLADDLKIKAVDHQADFILHLDTLAGRLWVTHEQMDDEQKEKAIQDAFLLAPGTRITDIQYAGSKPEDRSAQYQIRFKKQGYSDFAYIRMIEKESNLTLAIEPFLPQTRILNRHKYFENCN